MGSIWEFLENNKTVIVLNKYSDMHNFEIYAFPGKIHVLFYLTKFCIIY